MTADNTPNNTQDNTPHNTPYKTLTKEALQAQLDALSEEYARIAAKDLKLNMARGKPAPEQLDLSEPLLDVLSSKTDAALLRKKQADDLRNYGGLTGTPEARALMAAIMDVAPAETIVCDNSSLSVMYDTVARAKTHGIAGQTPWAQLGEPVKFLCPAPGYDRHFALTAHFGIEMILVPTSAEGPDMDFVEQQVNNDASIKGIWCVPKYANPTGVTYSEQTVERFAQLKPAAKDFRLYWDNAYAVHDLTEPGDSLASIKTACEKAGNSDLWYMFASTSKITFAGAGISALASSPKNIAEISEQLALRTIGSDKLNQLRHVLFLKDLDGVRAHMKKHAAIVAPKFTAFLEMLDEGLGDLDIGEWTRPKGGYFISFDGLPNTAKRVVQLAKEAGLTLTDAGATYPYGNDPIDANIRIAPTYPSLDELKEAGKLFVLCVKMASLEVLLREA
ncbi:MAG: aminotransferase class I/II-fold pyridoxal phosphate-dependent enzyme [Coriobacteriia bacterium]|jgi:aspartate/methionine/tyrosine aminotransferase|nr:aminotransferase class I/II-fold pyridoxal phosphate-dependent enzyme [Coriobacteriia bacterium]MDR2714387.1 aminotransferase class I/II-fold pyridoxal phosphate-dependent enzyme [Coriobacteriales bacterium]